VFLAELCIENFRIFGEGKQALVLALRPGLTALVGENDTGKTAIVDALRLVLGTRDQEYFRIDDNDFHQPPGGIERRNEIRIRCKFEDLTTPDKGAFAEHLTYEEHNGAKVAVLYVNWKAVAATQILRQRRFTSIETRSGIRQRFPMLFIDEVQDNNEDQSRILYRLFMDGHGSVRRQRYGDSNQAIYGYAGEEGATSDLFPNDAVRKDIPSSHRFGQQIAGFAKPLGLVPHDLVGDGPQAGTVSSDTTGKHTVFLFTDQTVRRVIPTYAAYLCEVFSSPELTAGEYAVVAAVHRRGADDIIPRFLGQYWAAYDPELPSAEPKAATFCQYIVAGRKQSEHSGEAHYVVERIAEAVFRLVRLSNPTADLGSRKRKHRQIVELLNATPDAAALYRELITGLAVDRAALTVDEWNKKWSPAVFRISGLEIDAMRVADFMQWQPQTDSDGSLQPRDNLFRHPSTQPKVRLRVGSIHSVKGETHNATLVLDTYFKKHHLKTLKPWLLGLKVGKEKEGPENQSRLKQHYVAMTRPTHLLCLAIREDAFSEAEITLLKSRSWRVARVRDDAHEWL
jgi:hypothetical protein